MDIRSRTLLFRIQGYIINSLYPQIVHLHQRRRLRFDGLVLLGAPFQENRQVAVRTIVLNRPVNHFDLTGATLPDAAPVGHATLLLRYSRIPVTLAEYDLPVKSSDQRNGSFRSVRSILHRRLNDNLALVIVLPHRQNFAPIVGYQNGRAFAVRILQASTVERQRPVQIDHFEAIPIPIKHVLPIAVHRFNVLHLLFVLVIGILRTNPATRVTNDERRTAHDAASPDDGVHVIS